MKELYAHVILVFYCSGETGNMEIRKPKTLEDFPKFIVTAVRRDMTSAAGYTRFELDGNFNRVINYDTHWFWLLFNDGEHLCASLKAINQETKTAILTCDQKDEPKIIGKTLAYLSSYWQAHHVWMVLNEDLLWEKTGFRAVDAISESFTADDGRHYHKLSKLQPGKDVPPDAQVVTNGWDHEHCELCNKHIDSGDYAYINTDRLWVCVSCFDKYVSPKDLSFVDEL
jgi:hypothetical protein